jgi:TolB-like protein/class 3 adenylate cyclase
MAGIEQRKLAAIMFTDMVGYSALSQRSEALALELLEEHRGIVRRILAKHGGREVKTTGDGFLIEFPSALAAVQGAVAIQNAFHERNQLHPAERQIRLRIGVHVGDVVASDGDIHGDGVNIAARLEPLAPAGGICVSNAVYEQVRNKLAQGFANLGPAELKNIELPVAVHRVLLPWEPPPEGRRHQVETGWKPRRGAAPGRLNASKLAAAAAAVALLAGGLGWWFVLRSGKPAGQTTRPPANAPAPPPENSPVPPGPASADQKSVAVLAFANLSDDKSNEYFSDGISEELLNALAKIPGLKVSARTSAFHFKGKDTPIPEIARELGVAYVIEGSVRKADTRVRITAQLIKAADGFHVWSDTFTRDLKDIFAVQDEIAGIIAKNLSLKLGVTSAVATVVNPEVLQLYFQGRQLWGVRSGEALEKMETLMTRALELDSRFAPAEAGLAQVWVTRAFVRAAAAQHLEPELAQVESHANRAIELDPASAESFEALGTAALIRGRLSEAEAAFLKAVAGNPNYATAWNKYAWLLERQGRVDAALLKYSLARDLDPLVWSISDGFSRGLLQVRRYAEAERSLSLEETLPVVAPPTLANHSLALLFLGRTNEAKAKARQVVGGPLPGDWDPGLQAWCRGLAAWVLAETGERTEAAAIAERLRTGAEGQRFGAGFALLALGREEEAYTALSAFPQQFIGYLWLLAQRHPQLSYDQHFGSLLEKLTASEAYHTVRETLRRMQTQPPPGK